MAANKKEEETVEKTLISLNDYLENTNLSEIDKFVFRQVVIDKEDKNLSDWEKIKINIFS